MAAIVFASDVFLPQAVVLAAHRYTGTCIVDVQSVPEGTRVVLTPRTADMDESSLTAQLRNDALDEQVRMQVREQTHELHAALVEAALAGAQPRNRPRQ